MVGNNIHVITYEPTDPRCGRHVAHDDRSFNYAFMSKSVVPKGIDVSWPSHTGPINQQETGSCTCSSLITLFNTDFAADVRIAAFGSDDKYFTQDHALALYALATRKYDNIPGYYPNEDTGSTGNAAAKAAKSLNWIHSYNWLFSFSSLQAAIEKTPLTVGTLWTKDMFKPVNGIVRVGSLADSNVVGGHQYAMTGIVWNDELFEFRQTWGDQDDWPGCKPGGYFAISFDDFRSLQEAHGDVTVPRWLT